MNCIDRRFSSMASDLLSAIFAILSNKRQLNGESSLQRGVRGHLLRWMPVRSMGQQRLNYSPKPSGLTHWCSVELASWGALSAADVRGVYSTYLSGSGSRVQNLKSKMSLEKRSKVS